MNSGSFEVLQTEDILKPNLKEVQMIKKTNENLNEIKIGNISCKSGLPQNLPLDQICNSKSLLYMAEHGKQPGIKPLMENYLVKPKTH
jgi:hypothetical protein